MQSIARELKKNVREKEGEKKRKGSEKEKERQALRELGTQPRCEFPRNRLGHHRTMTRQEFYGSQATVADLGNLFGCVYQRPTFGDVVFRCIVTRCELPLSEAFSKRLTLPTAGMPRSFCFGFFFSFPPPPPPPCLSQKWAGEDMGERERESRWSWGRERGGEEREGRERE